MTDDQQEAMAGSTKVTTPSDREIVTERVFDAPRDRVFAAVHPRPAPPAAAVRENHLADAPGQVECTRVVESPTGVTHLRYATR